MSADRTPEQATADAIDAARVHDVAVRKAREVRRRAIASAIADGAEVLAIARGAGVARSTVYGWMERRDGE